MEKGLGVESPVHVVGVHKCCQGNGIRSGTVLYADAMTPLRAVRARVSYSWENQVREAMSEREAGIG